ncbi:prenyltransferase/squalene oxidase repeat-containing protein [Thalassoroseus pseudoceratinae]|uniref:prenyltransferase/squalene oxidase repeat-containing protein n=1 Tax=Thalassoroseus pseudoceratinae TaxID=2713176 RepID=UPI001420952A|nr:prenyltransferase/squalene oxidase repeat-containing protein [Thalassoroseus pseudoceratinae]
MTHSENSVTESAAVEPPPPPSWLLKARQPESPQPPAWLVKSRESVNVATQTDPAPTQPAPPPEPVEETLETPEPIHEEDAAEQPTPSAYRRLVRHLSSAYGLSLILHAAVLLVMWLIVMPHDTKDMLLNLLVSNKEQTIEDLTFEVVEQPPELAPPQIDTDSELAPELTEMESLEPDTNELDISDLEASLDLKLDSLAGTPLDKITDHREGRSQANRDRALSKRGGNQASDNAVASGLEWLASVQKADGSWNFAEIGKSSQAGRLRNGENGATAMALMTFLGAGHTHTAPGPYQQTVKQGIDFLRLNFVSNRGPNGWDFRGENVGNAGMYIQGLVTIALCEAYGMTKDRLLRRPAEGAIQFIVKAQDPRGGGWRYQVQQAGDTSVVGWEIMALKSGHQAGLEVPRHAISGARKFLNSVAKNDGSQYSYTPGQGPKASTTAIGLLCRMYLGWDHEEEALGEGIRYLVETGPARNDMYYNYYATQSVIQYTNAEGELWNSWNRRMRDWLVKTQRKDGPEKGSWNLADRHGSQGGRLYMTCLAVMTLEVYYRVLPIYKDDASQKEF